MPAATVPQPCHPQPRTTAGRCRSCTGPVVLPSRISPASSRRRACCVDVRRRDAPPPQFLFNHVQRVGLHAAAVDRHPVEQVLRLRLAGVFLHAFRGRTAWLLPLPPPFIVGRPHAGLGTNRHGACVGIAGPVCVFDNPPQPRAKITSLSAKAGRKGESNDGPRRSARWTLGASVRPGQYSCHSAAACCCPPDGFRSRRAGRRRAPAAIPPRSSSSSMRG